MEVPPSPPAKERTHIVRKKVWNILRIFFMMVKNGILKSKALLDFNILFKKSNKLANKAITNLLLQHYAAFATRPAATTAAISPTNGDYEFSCSNSPAVTFSFANKFIKRNHHYDAAEAEKMFEMLNKEFDDDDAAAAAAAASPMLLPGYGVSQKLVRQLRVTDSPFPVKDDVGEEGRAAVDSAAEEFICRFYNNLKMQKTPCHDMWRRG